ncbi:MAG: site-specific DNA-methyltransferase, partial [Gammaproteobacteria bacterium]
MLQQILAIQGINLGDTLMPTLDFKGKPLVYSHHLAVPSRPLAPKVKQSLPPKGKKPSLDDNLIIHGDNLHALKALLPRYAGKVKCIYIDPPYNTGNEGWVYNDNVNSPLMQEWLKNASPVDGEDLERHDKWLCMMWPRLQLLKELLAEDGVICISCDDIELANLVSIMDEIFGSHNKEEIIAWRRRHNQPNDKSKPIAKTAEFIVVYAKDIEALKKIKSFNGLPLTGNFKNPDNDPRGAWASKPWKSGSSQTGTRYKITTPTGKVYDEEWLGTKATFNNLLKDKRIFFSKGGDGLPRKKYYELERMEEGQAAHNFWGHDEFGSNQDASREIGEIGISFDNSKPSRLIKAIAQIFSNKNSIILDSFAGSGTTAHAVLALNKEDNGNRKFILVECENYADKTTAERVRRIVKGTKSSKDEDLKNGIGGSFTYCTLGDEMSIENMLKGKKLPDYETLAHHVFWTATGQSPKAIRKARGKDG